MNLRLPFPLFALLLLLFSTSVQAQNRSNHWYFGYNAGLDFNSGNPVAVTDGKLYTREGCATISDNSGALLFYTDGITVYNKNHGIMLNGEGLNGDPSSTHSAVVVPKPGSFSEYYIFTVDIVAGGKGLQYSVVDMGLDGGLGGVTDKNILLESEVEEKIAAYKKTGSDDYWIMAQEHNSYAFLAYDLNTSGINTTPVRSNIGMGTFQDGYTGQIKFSTNGKRMAIANNWLVEVYDFDETTGQLSNLITLMRDDGKITYGIEFSPDSRLLYVNYYQGVCQFDLNAGTESDIDNSKVILMQAGDSFGSLQLGPDGKIYGVKVRKEYLDVIHNPNGVGTYCDYRYNDLYLNGREGFLGLPTFISNISSLNGNIDYGNTCLGEQTNFYATVQNPMATVLWDFGDGTTSTDMAPSHTYATSGTYTVTLTVMEGSVFNTESIMLTISEMPVAHTVQDVEKCVVSNTFDFDLNSLDTAILGTQDNNTFQIAYFASLSDVDNNTNALAPQMGFDVGITTIYVRISNNQNPSCYDTTSFDVIIKQAPELFVPADWVVCDTDGDGANIFDLSFKDNEILNGQDPNAFNISYYGSQLDAESRTNPLNMDHTVTDLNETVFYRIENTAYSDCFETGSFILGVIDQVVANKPTDLEICDLDNDGQAEFDLSTIEAEVLGGQSTSSVIVSYHGSQADADSDYNPLPNLFTSNAYQKTIYVRVSNAIDTSCYATNLFQLNIFEVPQVPIVSDWQVCDDDNDGLYTFDLTEKADELLANASGASLTFYESEADASLEQDPIYGNYQNTANPQTVYFRLNNTNNMACYSIGSFDLRIFDSPTAYRPSDVVICDDAETGIYAFNLSQKDNEVLNGQDPRYYEVSYHSSELDALNGDGPLSKDAYYNTGPNQTIYARIQHGQLPSCYNITDFNLIVNYLPEPNLDEEYVLCPDSPDLVLDAGMFDSYLWEYGKGNVVGNEQVISITDLGAYSLTVTETKNGVSCSNTRSFKVFSSGAPESFEVVTDGLSDRITLTVNATGIGDFEYSIDGQSYQASNNFIVLPGEYTVYVRDPLGCRELSKEVFAIGYQRFFTPNGDSVNDTWNIVGRELYPESELYIYDRYGKLLVQIMPYASGWDGTFMGKPMPSSDYWFKYIYDDGKIYTGHFSLRR